MPRPAAVAFLPLIVALAGCRAGPDPVGVEHLHERIASIAIDSDGIAWIGFERSARAFVILPSQPELLAFAEQAKDRGQPVHATVRSGHGAKSAAAATTALPRDPAALAAIAIVRLGYEPDPAAR